MREEEEEVRYRRESKGVHVHTQTNKGISLGLPMLSCAAYGSRRCYTPLRPTATPRLQRFSDEWSGHKAHHTHYRRLMLQRGMHVCTDFVGI